MAGSSGSKARSIPVFGTEGTIVGFIAVQEDITSRKKAEEERRNLEAQVMQMQKMESIGTLAGGVAHDFNNILGIILGHCSLITRVISDPVRVTKSVDAINKAVQRGASLVRQILTFARKTDVQFEQVRLGDVITEFVKMLEETFPKTISFEVSLENKAAVIDADKTQLHQTLLNLCVNARDAMPNGGNDLDHDGSVLREPALRERFPDASADCYERVQGRGYRNRHGRANAATDLRAVLHDQVARQRNRPGSRRRIRYHQQPSWLH